MKIGSLSTYLFAVVLCLSVQSLLYAQPPKTTLPKVLTKAPTQPKALTSVTLNAWIEDGPNEPAASANPLRLKWQRVVPIVESGAVESPNGYFDIEVVRWPGCTLYFEAPSDCERQQKEWFGELENAPRGGNVLLNLPKKLVIGVGPPVIFTFFFQNPTTDPKLVEGNQYLFQIREKESSGRVVAVSKIVSFTRNPK